MQFAQRSTKDIQTCISDYANSHTGNDPLLASLAAVRVVLRAWFMGVGVPGVPTTARHDADVTTPTSRGRTIFKYAAPWLRRVADAAVTNGHVQRHRIDDAFTGIIALQRHLAAVE